MIKKYLKQFQEIEEIEFNSVYSKYKYGCKESINALALLFTNLIYESIPKDKEVLIIGSSCDNLDNPISILSKQVTIELSKIFPHKVHLTKIHRIIRHDQPYCQMIFEDRKNLISKDVLHFDHSMTLNRTVIMLDDVYITGAHEQKVLEVIKPDYYFYLLKYNGLDASIEERLNLNDINIDKLVNMYIDNQLIWNSRNVKYILKNQNDLNLDIKIIRDMLNEVKDLAYLNGYQHIDNLKELL